MLERSAINSVDNKNRETGGQSVMRPHGSGSLMSAKNDNSAKKKKRKWKKSRPESGDFLAK